MIESVFIAGGGAMTMGFIVVRFTVLLLLVEVLRELVEIAITQLDEHQSW